MAALNRKYIGLPDLDEAPDTYETPALTDGGSTVQTTTVATISPNESDDEDEVGSDIEQRRAAINRRRINQDEARTRFEPSLVNARDVDFSDRLGSSHRSYRTANRRRRRRSQLGTEELGDWSEEEEENPQVRLARLRREAEELKQQIDEAAEHGGSDNSNDDLADGVRALSSMLDGLHTLSRNGQSAAQAYLSSISKPISTATRQTEPTTNDTSNQPLPATTSIFQPQAEPPSSALTAATDLSDRLSSLETILGLSAPSTAISTPPILPTLSSLFNQITTLTSTLVPSSHSLPTSSSIRLEELTTKLRTLTLESERLVSARKAATAAALELSSARSAAAATGHPNSSSNGDNLVVEQKLHSATTAANAGLSLSVLDDQTAKIRSLYQTLPTIMDLHPLLPMVLERLRSLQRIHAGAAEAEDDLRAIEEKQREMDDELSQWRDTLTTVEGKMLMGEEAMKGNVEVIGNMIRGIEERVEKLNQQNS